MRPHDLDALEYPRVLDKLASFAHSPAGAAACRSLSPSTDSDEVGRRLDASEQLFRVSMDEHALASSAAADIREHLKTAAHEGFVLEGTRLVEIRQVLATMREVGAFLRNRRDRLPALAPLVERFHPFRDLEDVLNRALEDDGSVRDAASDELAALRAEMRTLRAKLTRRLEALVHRSSLADVVAEDYVTLRNNRFVVPVKAHYGQKIQGIVQDRSASGETIFLEPLFAVDLNNELMMTAREEERVVRRILADLTGLVRGRVDELGDTFAALTSYDVVAAGVRFAERYGGTRPSPSDGAIELPGARHPLLLFGDRPVVPVDIQLPPGKDTLIITGPNTGGKTVALKTVGLLSLMAQTGLLIPAKPGSCLPCWRGVFADVGDEQNIQRNLSTFSGHVANLVGIDRSMESPALLLLDEPGVGTDPEEGAALAIGLLDTWARPGVRIIATTHYTPVKLFGLTRDSCVTASVDFDRATLAPRYRLLYHSLGESLALVISEQLGLSQAVLARAREVQSEQSRTLNEALTKLETSRREYEARLDDVRTRGDALAARERESAALLEELRQRRQQKWRSELDTARDFVRDLRAEGRRVLAALEERTATRRDLDRFIDNAVGVIAAQEKEAAPAEPSLLGPPQVGDEVETTTGSFRGELVSVSGERAWIRRGTMRVEIPYNQLRRSARAKEAAVAARPMLSEGEIPPAEVMLVGLRAKEALAKLESYLDRAALAGHGSVRIIHGIGSGALRRAVQEYLDVSPYCSRFRDGEASEGGAGVTVADLGG